MNPVRRALIDAIVRLYTLEQFSAVVYSLLHHRLEYYAPLTDAPTAVERFMAALERGVEDREKFWADLQAREIRLRAAIDAYFGVPHDSAAYDALMVLDEPFVDRQLSRDKLKQLFQNENRRAMVVRGARAVGKSYLRWLIEHVARSEGIQPVFVQLKDNSVQDVVAQLINDLSLPPREFNDRLAQASTTTKLFVSALRGSARQMLNQRWCLVFDSYDYDTVEKTMRDFVDALLADVTDLQMPPIWMVVLGHRPAATPLGVVRPSARLIADDILPLTQPDIEKFFEQLAAVLGKAFPTTTATEVFDGLTPPLDHDGMATLTERLRDKIGEIGV